MQHDATTESLSQFVAADIEKGSAVIETNGQYIVFYLNRKTISTNKK